MEKEKIIREFSDHSRAEVISPVEGELTASFDPRNIQWVESDCTYEYNDKGDIIYSHETYYHVPELELSQLFPFLGEICACEEEPESRREAEKEEPEDAAFRLTPQGIALMAAIDSGMAESFHDRRFDCFWQLFRDGMIANGYAVEEESE